MPDSIELTTLVKRIKQNIDYIAYSEEWPLDAVQSASMITGLYIAALTACVKCFRFDLADEIEEYANDAKAWVYQRDEVRRYLKAA